MTLSQIEYVAMVLKITVESVRNYPEIAEKSLQEQLILLGAELKRCGP